MRTLLSIIFFLGLALTVNAQKERKFIREGNNLFHGQNFENAEREYRKALEQKDESFEAAFNLADAMYKQQRYDEALEQFQALAASEMDKERLGEIYHNIGNALLSMNKVDESIEAYKNSLRNRPESMETKYNLEYARHRKQQEEENQDDNQDQENQDQDQNDQNKDQNQDQNQDKQDQDQNQDKGDDQQNQDNQDPGNDDADQNQQQQDQEAKISKEDAQRLLEALQNDEKKVQEKVQQQKAEQQKAKRQKIEKDW